MQLIFEKSKPGRHQTLLPPCDVPTVSVSEPREQALPLPEISENDLCRHYTELMKRTFGVNDGFYPLGSCTMKYNPKLHEEIAAWEGFQDIHPLQPAETVAGCLEVLAETEKYLAEITGMDGITLQPAAGAHGEFTGLLLIKAYHESRNDTARTRIIVPDSAHGTNPASAVMAGFTVVNIPSGPDGCVDLDALRAACDATTAGLMLTNPNTVGLFDRNIEAITEIVHAAGGLCYYDGANLNAVLGIARPGDMGFDVMHVNLHKSFSTPHGGGGPGSGPVGCKAFLKPFLPESVSGRDAQSIGRVRSFWGNFLVVVRALAYLRTLGSDGIPEVAKNAVLNANYMMARLRQAYDMAYDHSCMHEFVMDLSRLKHDHDISAMDIAKGLLDLGIHPPTMYFPLIVHEALMIEPTETESKETLDQAVDAFLKLREQAETASQTLHEAPHQTVVRRLDEVGAARNPRINFFK